MVRRKLSELWPLDRRGTHAFLVLSAILASFIFVIALEKVFTPFFIALLLAYILNPIVNFGEKYRIPRWCSTFLVFIFFIILILFFILVIIPSIAQEMKEISLHQGTFKNTPEILIQEFRVITKAYLDERAIEKATEIARSWADAVQTSGVFVKDAFLVAGKHILSKLGSFTGFLLSLLLIPFYMFFLLTSLNRIWDFTETYLMPYDYKDSILRITAKIHHSLSAFFRGRLLICLIMGNVSWLGLLYLNVPFPFLLGFSIGFATFIPLLGLLILLPALGLFWMSGAGFEDMLYLIIFYSLIQSIEMFILSPFLLGKEVELPPMILVLSLLVCAYLFGGIGFVLAVPIASTTKILFYEFIFPSFVELSKKNANSTEN